MLVIGKNVTCNNVTLPNQDCVKWIVETHGFLKFKGKCLDVFKLGDIGYS